MFWSSDSDKGVGRRGSCLLLNSMRKKKKKKRAITAPWQASELSWDGCLLVNSPLGGNFLPSPRRSRDPRELGPGTAHLWVSVSKSVKRHSSRGSLCTAERIWDLTDAPTGQRQSLRAETRGLGGNAWRAVPWAQSGAPGQGPAGDAGAPLRGAGAGCHPQTSVHQVQGKLVQVPETTIPTKHSPESPQVLQSRLNLPSITQPPCVHPQVCLTLW